MAAAKQETRIMKTQAEITEERIDEIDRTSYTFDDQTYALRYHCRELAAKLDALEKPVSDAGRWARVYQSALRKASDYWAEFDTFSEHRQRQCIAAMQPVLDGIRTEWAQERNDLIIRERHSNDVVSQYIEEVRRLRCAVTDITAELNEAKSKLAEIQLRNIDNFMRELEASDDEPTCAELAKEHECDPDLAGGIWENAREHFRPKIVSLEAERNALKTQVDALAVRAAGLEAERDALAARVQKGGVGFDVTEEEFCDDWMASKGETWSAFCLRYFAEHATVVRPNISRERWRAGGGGIFMSGDEWTCAYAIIVTAHNAILDELERVEAAVSHPPGDLPIFPPRDQTKPQSAQGIYQKYNVSRTDGSDAPGAKHDGCSYFVIDRTHDQFAGAALQAYGLLCAEKYPVLSKELLDAYPVVTPGDLPSARELLSVCLEAVERHPTVNGCHVAGMSAVLAHLRPWLRPEDPPGDLPTVEELVRVYNAGFSSSPAANVFKADEDGLTAVLDHLRPWLRPGTINRDQLDTAARVITTQRVIDENSTLADTARGIAQDVFAAVGITVEQENDE